MNKKKVLGFLVGCVFIIFILLFMVAITLPLPRVDVPEQTSMTITGVTVVRPGQGRLQNHTLSLSDGIIHSLTPTALGEESTNSELAGTYALPGLVDMHVHHMPDIAGLTQLWDLLYLAHGVTTVRDLGVTSEPTSAPMKLLSSQIKNGEVIGPRIFYCGPTLDGDPVTISHFRMVRDEDEAQSVVAELVDQGCSCVKTYNLMAPDVFRSVHDHAEKSGLRHVAHLPNGMDVSDAADVDLQHYVGIGSADTLTRFSDYWKGWPDVDEKMMATIVSTSLEHNITHTPTISMWKNVSIMFDPESKNLPQAKLVPRFFRDVIWTAEGGEPQFRDLTTTEIQSLAAAIPKMQQLTRMLYEGGVPVFIGTDPVMPHSVPGITMYQEMRLFVEAGLTPEQAWKIATKDAADWLGNEKIGRLETGAYADVLFFKEDPTLDLANLDTLVGVIADGRYYSKQALDAAVREQQVKFNGAVFDSLSMIIAKMFF